MSTTRQGLADLPFGSGYSAFGCSVNSITVDALFSRYEACGFLYPEKRDRLRPYMPLIADNWRRSMSAGAVQFLHHVVVYDNPSTEAWASVTYWASSNTTVHSQHLVSVGRPEASRAVLLSAQSELYAHGRTACQNWFRAQNRFPSRVFGTCTNALGSESACVQQHVLLAVDRALVPRPDGAIRVRTVMDPDAPALCRLARHLCGIVQAQADEWEAGDVGLAALDERYQAVGLRRFRRVFVATAPGSGQPVGLAVAYRGPLGLSFSFLENRCELWLEPSLEHERRAQAVRALVSAASLTYDTFELPYMLITADAHTAQILVSAGARSLQEYSRSVWLQSAYGAWYNHVNRFYTRAVDVANRRGSRGNNGTAL